MADRLNSDILFDCSEKRNLISHCRMSIFGSLGFAQEDLFHKPLIGIANSFTDINPGHMHLDKLAEAVKEGILQAGGTAVQFNTPAPCDATSCGLEPMKYILPQRDLISDSIEMMVRCNSFDGLVFLSSCDKIVPGQLMAAARLNLPSIFVTGGPSLPAMFFAPKDKAAEQDPTEQFIATGDPDLIPTIFGCHGGGAGACSGFGTANTMQAMAEALGMTLPGCSTVLAVDPEKTRYARASGRRVVEMVHEQLLPEKIITKEALENAICVHTAMAGSTNAVIHLCAIAHERGIDIGVSDFERLGRGIPCVCGVVPSGHHSHLDLHRAGGIPALQKRIGKYLHKDALTVEGSCVGAVIDKAVICDEEVIRPLDNPFYEGGGLAILRGNLAPDSAVIKASAVKPEMRLHTGPAKVFNSEVEARIAINDGKIEHGDVIVIRYEGPKGGPGMREMLMITKYLVYSGKADDVALVTDGRFSGFTAGPAVGHVCPEASDGGPIALVEDGDLVSIDIVNRSLTLHVSDNVLAARRRDWTPIKRELSGYLKRYSETVTSSAEGAWLK